MNPPNLPSFSSLPSALPRGFYARPTLQVARDLLGMHLCHALEEGRVVSGRIVEVEAYLGPGDRASHARARQRGAELVPYGRSTLMFGLPGVAYVYVIYGLHHCFNVVAHEDGAVGAVLVRALEPGLPVGDCRGPGRLCKALAIDRRYNGADLCPDGESASPRLPIAKSAAPQLLIADLGTLVADADVAATARIGVDYAGEDALLPYRFCDRRSAFLSRRL